MSSNDLDRSLVLDAVRVTEAAAIAAWKLVGRGDEKAADQAAVDAMRTALNTLEIDGEIVIGEGERDEAPMLYIGEKVGLGQGHKIDIALDPLEGTTLTAKAMANALAVMAWAPKGTLLNAPDTYMDKIACGPGYAEGVIDLDASPADNVKAMAKAKGVDPAEITVCVLDRPRHAEIINSVRGVGARIHLITDGDVAGVMNTAEPETGIDLYIGQGGAPEGVLACAALKCVGGQFQGRLVFRNADEKARAQRLGVTDFGRKYSLHEIVRADAIFAATGVTKGALLDGVKFAGGFVTTDSMVMNSSTRTVR
ncbi:MAG TPA: class II fructose-bisphosphatase, partial [Caulobacteraceae bacterium]|nr:class II fructose-bisphosphatase [Caulobacteraceae bacterium]